MNPIIFIPSPRDRPEFLEATAKINCDKLWIKYYNQDDAYRIAREWFLTNKQYTHLVILPDDLIVTQNDFDVLCEDANNFNVVSGWCRNTIRLIEDWKGPPETEETADSNISINSLPPDPPYTSTYNRYHFTSIKEIQEKISYGITFVRVKFSGFPLQFISRVVVEQVPFRTSEGCCVDSCFALDLASAGIKQFVNLLVRTTHIQTKNSELKVNKEKPDIIFENKKS
jgi:hypothetical protein